jgi:copper transport protein
MSAAFRRGILALGTGLALLWLALPALAHGYLVRSIPQDRSVLERAPTRLQYWFSEDLEPRFSSLVLRDAQGNVIAEGGVDAANNALLTLSLPPGALADGTYVVELRPAFSADGHAVLFTNVFSVGAATSDIASTLASPLAQPLEVVWKVMLLSGTFLLFGTGVLYTQVLVPAWGSSAYPAGFLPPRLMQRLNAMMWAGLALAIGGNILALAQQTMVFFNISLAEVFSSGLWQVTRIGSRFGDVWNVRMLFLLVMAGLHFASLYSRDRAPALVTRFWTAGTWCMALVLAAQAVVSHAAGSLVMPWLALTMHWLHTLATAFWVGGVAALALVLPVALAPYTGEKRVTAAQAVLRAFSRRMVGALLIVIFTGLYNSANWFYSPADVATTYGAALGLKVLLAALLAGLGAAHHLALRPALAARLGVGSWPFIRHSGHFSRTLNAEALIGIVVLASAALLSSTPIPQPDFLNRRLPPQTQTQQVGDLAVTMSLSPGGTGINTADIALTRTGSPADAARVFVQFSAPDRDLRSLPLPADPVDTGVYSVAFDTFDAPGRWWSAVDLYFADNTRARAAFEWQITAEANVITSVPASWITVLAAAFVTASVGVLLMPWAQRVAARLDLTPQSLLAAGLVTGITAVVLVFAVVSVENQRLEQARQLNPPPGRINPTLPVADSIARGEQAYMESCIIWQSVTDFRAFMNQVNTLRDEDIYNAVVQGWRAMPACHPPHDDARVWDIVNYVRVLQYQFRPR